MNNGGDAEVDCSIETQEQEPLRQKRGVSNGGSGSNAIIVPAVRRKKQPPRFELDQESQNWISDHDQSSPSPSPIPSPSSPYRKKLVFTMSGIVRPKEPREYKLRVFVLCTFFVLVLMISLTYVYHQQYLLQMMQVTVGESIRFSENNRYLHITNSAKQDILVARLGTTLSTKELPHNCPIDKSLNQTACLEWHQKARMTVVRLSELGSTKCYRLNWESKQDGLNLQDCFVISDTFWYGVGEYTPQLWPMNFLEANATLFVTGNLSRETYGHILERYWLCSKGVAIIAPSTINLNVMFNFADAGQLCLLTTPTSQLPRQVMNYTLCVATDAREVHKHVAKTLRPKPTRPNELSSTIHNVVFSTYQRFGNNINETVLLNYTDDLQSFEQTDLRRTLIVDSLWQGVEGDFTFDLQRFPNAKETISILHNRGYNIVLRVHPYVSTTSSSYYNYLDFNFWIRDITGQVPSLVRWSHLKSSVMLDFTNSAATQWFYQKLKTLHDEYKVTSFQFDGGDSTSLPRYPTFNVTPSSQNDFTTLYNKVAVNSTFAFSVNVISQLQDKFPIFTELSPRQSVWGLPRGLRSIIPAVLSTGLVGYPFTLIGPVGGYTAPGGRPERDLYVRWLQVAIFFPVLQMSVLPSDYDDEVASIAVKQLQFRRTIVLPKLEAAIQESLEQGIPVIRPIWWLAPNDSSAHDIDSEFVVGNDLLVAPTLEPHADQRDIYLPPGLWTDRNGNVHKGGKWIYDYYSSLSKVAYFLRMADMQQQQQQQQFHH